MIYSVFSWETGRYRYFNGPGEGLGIRPRVTALNDENGHHQLEELLPRVPAGSRPAGEGMEPRGRIATTGEIEAGGSGGGGGSLISGFGGESSTSPWLTLLLWGSVIYLASVLAENIGHKVERQLK